MKNLVRKIIDKIKNFLKWIWGECKDWRTILLLLGVIVVVYSPVWVCYLLYIIFRWNWSFAVATAVLAFWVGPFTPFFPLCIAITLGIKKRVVRFARRIRKKDFAMPRKNKK